MDAFTKFLTDWVCVQTAVYWSAPMDDGRGGYTWDQAREIKCRWDDTQVMFVDAQGHELLSQAVVMTLEDLDLNGMLCLSTIEQLQLDEYLVGNLHDPTKIPAAYPIRKQTKNPMLASATVFFRQVYLANG